MKTIGLDVDGVLADWTEAVMQAIGCPLSIDEITDFELEDVVRQRCGDAMADQIRKVCNDPSFTLNQRELPWAQELVAAARAFGEVTIVTSPWRTTGWYDARLQWLADHFGFSRKDVLVGTRKERTRFDIFVDDKPANCRAWSRANPDRLVFMPAWPYNATPEIANVHRLGMRHIIDYLVAYRAP